MKRIFLLFLALYGVESSGQTNSEPATSDLFSTPATQLWTPIGPERPLTGTNESMSLQSFPGRESASNSASATILLSGLATKPSVSETREDFSLNSFQNKFDSAIYERLDRAGYFARRELRSENVFDRSINAIFEPEVFRVGKTAISFTPLTAIKRKNPLCLINPIVLHISW